MNIIQGLRQAEGWLQAVVLKSPQAAVQRAQEAGPQSIRFARALDCVERAERQLGERWWNGKLSLPALQRDVQQLGRLRAQLEQPRDGDVGPPALGLARDAMTYVRIANAVPVGVQLTPGTSAQQARLQTLGRQLDVQIRSAGAKLAQQADASAPQAQKRLHALSDAGNPTRTALLKEYLRRPEQACLATAPGTSATTAVQAQRWQTALGLAGSPQNADLVASSMEMQLHWHEGRISPAVLERLLDTHAAASAAPYSDDAITDEVYRLSARLELADSLKTCPTGCLPVDSPVNARWLHGHAVATAVKLDIALSTARQAADAAHNSSNASSTYYHQVARWAQNGGQARFYSAQR